MKNKLGLACVLTLCAGPLWAGIYIGTDATPPQTYQSNANYPQNIVVSGNTAAERNCRLYYDGKGPIPPLTCSGSTPAVASAPVPKSPAPGMSSVPPVPKTPAPGMAQTAPVITPVVVPTKNDQAAQQAPLAQSTTTIPPLVRPPVANKVETPPPPMFVTTAEPGSLKANVERIVAQSHWGTVVWTLPIDYNWKGTMTIKAPDVQSALSQLLKAYPVRAIFYDKNHIVVIESRRVI